MRILTTGAGLLGTYATHHLRKNNHAVVLFDHAPDGAYVESVVGEPTQLFTGDIRDVNALAAAIAESQAEVVVHTAGSLAARFSQNPFDSYATNVYGSLCVVEAARRERVCRLVFCSSLAVYDLSRNLDAIREEDPLAPVSLYDHSKHVAELVVRSYGQAQGIKVVTLRLAGVYGPGQFKGGAWMGKQIHRLMVTARTGQRTVVTADDLGVNEYLYVKDAAAAIAAATTVPLARGEVINVGPGRLTSSEDIARALAAVFPGAHIAHEHVPMESLPPYLRRTGPLCIDKARRFLGYQPRYPDIESGIRDYAAEIVRLSVAHNPPADALP